ncbi:deubiquitinating enzyme [Rhizina undulata]
MSTIPVVVKHAGKQYNVDLDTTQPGEVFKYQLYSLTGVEPDRQKVLIKGGQLKDDTDLSALNLKPGHSFMMMGTAIGKQVQPPKEKPKFLEDLTDSQLAQTEGATPSGLQNLGNTCYMNSTLQTLRFVPELQQELQKYSGGGEAINEAFGFPRESSSSVFAALGGTDLTASLRDLYQQMGNTTEGFHPVVFVNALRQAFPQFAQKAKDGRYAQQDAEECYSQIIQILRQKLKIKNGDGIDSEVSFVDKFLAGRMSHVLKCDEEMADEPPVKTEDAFLDFKCHINLSTNHLRDGLMAGLVEKIEKESPTLGRNAVYTKTSRITRLPKYLTCHFVRFFWKRDINKKAKIMRKISFPLELDATEFCSDDLRKKLIPVRDRLRDLRKDASDRERARKRLKRSLHNDDIAGGNAGAGGFGAGKEGKETKEEVEKEEAARKKVEHDDANAPDWEQELKDKLDPELVKDEGCNASGLYELMGVISHQGASADSGHYCSYVKKEGGDGKSWYFFNDDKVSEVNQDKIESLAGGGEAHSALILLYRAVPLTPPEAEKKGKGRA